jgi:hypothetical protein
MLTELRSYDFAPGDAIRYLDLFRQQGLPLITAHLPLAGYWLTEIGPLNRLHHLWIYRDLADRTVRRARFMQDRAWTEGFLPRGLALVRRQESRLLQLVEPSPDFEAVMAKADQPHESQSASAALLAPGWITLSMGDAAARLPSRFARWVVVAGEGAGTAVAAARSVQPPSLPLFDAAAGSVELCRPAAFSPLR